MNTLTPSQRRGLRAQAHGLHPVVTIAGNGLSDPVVNEIDRSLNAHGLIKIRVHGGDRVQRQDYLAEICARLDAEAIQTIGNILIIFRPLPESPPPTKPDPEPRKRAAAPRRVSQPASNRKGPANTGRAGSAAGTSRLRSRARGRSSAR